MKDIFNNRPDLKFKQNLQNQFENFNFNNIPISKIIASNITQSFLEDEKGNLKIIKEIFNFIYITLFRNFYIFLKNFDFQISNQKNSTPIIIEALSNQSRIKDFWFPVATMFSRDECILVTENKGVLQGFKNEFNILIPHRFSLYDWVMSRFFIFFYFLPFFLRLNIPCSFVLKIRVISDIIYQINSCLCSDYIVNTFRARVFLTVWDLHPLGAVFCNTFRKYNLPSITFLHGPIGKKSLVEFLPLNTDYVISWGKFNSQLLENNGVEKAKIFDGGCTRMDKYNFIGEKKITILKEKYRLPSDKKVICFLNTAIIRDAWINDVNKIYNKLKDNYYFICRPHPSNNIKLLLNVFNNNISIITHNDLTLFETIDISDFFITDSSSAGFEVLFMNKMTFVLDSNKIEVYQDIMYDICKMNAASFSRSIDHLMYSIDKYESNSNYRNEILKNQNKFRKEFVSCYKDDSAKKIKNFILKKI